MPDEIPARGALKSITVEENARRSPPITVRGLVASLAALVAVGCNAELRFDQVVVGGVESGVGGPAGDAAAIVDAAVAPDGPAAVVDLRAPEDVPPSVDLAAVVDSAPPPPDLGAADVRPDVAPDLAADLAPVGGCPVGLCGWTPACAGDGCNVDCRGTASCSGSCGLDCSARCRGGTTCSVTTGEGAGLECREGAACTFVVASGTARCRESASCSVHCLGPCTLDCEEARCRLQCATDAAARTVTGTVRCP